MSNDIKYSALQKLAAAILPQYDTGPYWNKPKEADDFDYTDRSEWEQRLDNLKAYGQTQAYDYLNNAGRALAHTFLPGSAYDVAKDTYKEFFSGNPLSWVLSPIKPKSRVETWRDAIHAKPRLAGELPATKYNDPKTLSYQLVQKMRQKTPEARMKAWDMDVPRQQAPYDLAPMPYQNEFFDLALQEARTGDYKYLASQGYSDEAIARMIVDKYYQPALYEAAGGKRLKPTEDLTPEQWNKWRDLQVKRQVTAAEAMNPDYKATDADRAHYAKLYEDNMKAIAANANKRRMMTREGLLPAQEVKK